jgi:hypothetical protein
MRRAVAVCATLALTMAMLVFSGNPASAAISPQGSYGCKTDTIAAEVINGLTYTATEKTCVEIVAGPAARTHGVTRCYRSGSPFNCLIINGDTVGVLLWYAMSVARTAPGDTDCSNCFENSHYSQTKRCVDQPETFQGSEDNLRVAWVSGHISSLHTHASFAVTLRC